MTFVKRAFSAVLIVGVLAVGSSACEYRYHCEQTTLHAPGDQCY